MQLLAFDEINKYVTFREWLDSLEPSEVMEEKERIRDELWDLLEYLYVLGFVSAREELGVIAEDAKGLLPTDYMKAADNRPQKSEPPKGNEPPKGGESKSGKGTSTIKTVESVLPTDYRNAMDESIYKKFDGLNFADRTLSYAELGDKEGIIRVAETDGHRVYQDGGYQGAKGIAKTKTWLTMLDDKVRDTHDYLEGMTVGFDEKFYTFDGDSARYPGDFESVANNARCRCVISYNK